MKDFVIHNSQSDKEVFVKYYDFIKAKTTRAKNIEELHEIESSIKNEAHRREHKLLLRLAIDFCEINNVINLSCANWDNIKRAVKLYRQVVKYDMVEISEYIDTLSHIWEKGMSCHRYNSILSDLLKTLKKTHSVPMSISSAELDSMLHAINNLSEEEKMFILSKLANELKINLPESNL